MPNMRKPAIGAFPFWLDAEDSEFRNMDSAWCLRVIMLVLRAGD